MIMSAENLLPLAFAAIIGFGIFMYVLMDGFDLGVGILFPFVAGEDERNRMMNSVAPVWDGNETWLVLGGAALFGAFPIAYGALLSAFYIPILIMLVALVFRGIAFEFRFKAGRYKYLWDIAFSGGSLIATVSQGVLLGAYIEGVEIKAGAYAGGALDWLTPFSALTGISLIPGYALLGSTWLVLKTDGRLRDWARSMALWQLAGVMVFMAAVSAITPLGNSLIFQRWFSWPNIAFLAPVPLAVALTGFFIMRALQKDREVWPFVLSMLLFWLGFSGLAISVWPWLVPYAISMQEAASPVATQSFMLWGFAIFIPLNLIYTAHAYWVFRGKVASGDGYGH